MKLSVITAVAMLAAVPAERGVFAQAASATQARPSDQELSSVIATKIANDKSLSADAIKVTVEGGVVTLTGMVGTDAGKLKAEQLARVTGVERVDNKLVSRQKATDATKSAAGTVADTTKKGAQKTKEVLSKTGEVITDTWITSRVKAKFMGDEALRASAINVDSKDNVVTLTGAVPDAASRTKALAMAKEVEGVSRVVDKLKIASEVKAP
jgi:osmotically-inducible protein OsmY